MSLLCESDRISRCRHLIMNRTSALAHAGQDGEQARGQARSFEDEIFKKSTSSHEYQSQLDRLIAHLEPKHPPESALETVSADADEVLNPDGPTMGHFLFATFHQDGQTSTIFKAKDQSWIAPSRIVALKVTYPASLSPPHDTKREARLLSECHHDRVVPLLETFTESNGRFILVFPFLRQDLENLIRTGTLTEKQTSMVFDGLFEALTHIHSLGIIHRDIKPSNILLQSTDGPVYLIDFGIAWSPRDADSEAADKKITDVGTTCYRPPELLFGHQAYDMSLDMWAAGCVIGEMVRNDAHPLFDAGPVGSELGLIKSMFTTLGTPTDESWPSAAMYPDWDKITFKHFDGKPWMEILPGASECAIGFVSRTVCFETSERLTASDALKHPLRNELAKVP